MHQNKKIKSFLEKQIQINKLKKHQKNKFVKMKENLKIKKNMLKILKNQKNLKFFENFELLEYINSGSSGVVYKGFYLKAPQKYICFKFLLNEFFKDKVEYNIKESKYLDNNIKNKLKSKNIIEYYEHINLKNIGCIIMEFAKFGDLENFQKIINSKRHFSETLLSFIAKQILNGLDFLHQSKIVHMDIKPQNILIDEKLNIKITDFSVSFSYKNYNRNEKIVLPFSGTNLYMSPEIISRTKIDYEDCSKIDLFSLGVVLYNLAFEKFPYDLSYYYTNNLGLLLTKINQSKLLIPKLDRNYSKYFQNFLSGLLEKNIKKRTSIQQALNDPWIKGADLIFKEKEKINDLEKFLINMITDNIISFNEYLKKNNEINI